MTTRIAKWGNSLGLRLPKSVTQEAQLDEGDKVDVIGPGGSHCHPAEPADLFARGARLQNHRREPT